MDVKMKQLVSPSLALLLACSHSGRARPDASERRQSPGGPAVFEYDQMKASAMPNGAESQAVFNGTLATARRSML
jgi:hypothetical protein